MRGYAPTEVPEDGCFSLGALVADATAVHDALGADADAVIVGHDWGAEAAYGAAVLEPERWRRVVALAVPPPALDEALFSDYEQLKRFFYLFMFQAPVAREIVGADGMGFLDRLWAEWSPGYAAGEDLARAKECLRDPTNLSAALAYYRDEPAGSDPDCDPYAEESKAASGRPPQPTLYLHGETDGCIHVDLLGEVPRFLAPGSKMVVVERAGHFLHLERPSRSTSRSSPGSQADAVSPLWRAENVSTSSPARPGSNGSRAISRR
jgi:pimeloyl-ACP methyl ester carboxylesterase